MGLIKTAGTEAKTTRNEPEARTRPTTAAVGTHGQLLRNMTLAIGAKPFAAFVVFAPVFRECFKLACEYVSTIPFFARRHKIPGDIVLVLVVNWGVIDIAG